MDGGAYPSGTELSAALSLATAAGTDVEDGGC